MKFYFYLSTVYQYFEEVTFIHDTQVKMYQMLQSEKITFSFFDLFSFKQIRLFFPLTPPHYLYQTHKNLLFLLNIFEYPV